MYARLPVSNYDKRDVNWLATIKRAVRTRKKLQIAFTNEEKFWLEKQKGMKLQRRELGENRAKPEWSALVSGRSLKRTALCGQNYRRFAKTKFAVQQHRQFDNPRQLFTPSRTGGL